MDEIFIPEALLNSTLSRHIMDEEKQNMLRRHASIIRKEAVKPVFYLDAVPSATNNFTSLDLKKKA